MEDAPTKVFQLRVILKIGFQLQTAVRYSILFLEVLGISWNIVFVLCQKETPT